jgi:hypothetical protein
VAGLSEQAPTRRSVIHGGAALALAAATALPAQAAAKYRRHNVRSKEGMAALASYKKAIRAMLALPPEDPRNWYRLALVHTVDCPHGNWWFLPWHRGYLGWFEQTCRELSGDATFAIPYWDWSEDTGPNGEFKPAVPAAMYEEILDPSGPGFIPTYDAFYNRYADVVRKLPWWDRAGANGGQYEQLLNRGVRFPEDLWFDIAQDPRGLFFFDLAHARGLPKDKPQLDAATTKTVLKATILDGLGPRDFLSFASPKTFFHGSVTGFGIIEGQPHNNVHNCVGGAYNGAGGFMQANLSPVDPLFFLHHSNIDRLWDVWTRKQMGRGYPILPEGADLARWRGENFLFFTDAKGAPVTKTKAGDYAAIGAFDYDYQPGTGEEVVPPAAAAAKAPLRAAPTQRFTATILNSTIAAGAPARATVTMPSGLLAAPAQTAPLFAEVTVDFGTGDHAPVALMLNAPAGETPDPTRDDYVATLAMFGHHGAHGPVTFTVPLSRTMAAERAKGRLRAAGPMTFTLMPLPTPGAEHLLHGAAGGPAPELVGVSVGAR